MVAMQGRIMQPEYDKEPNQTITSPMVVKLIVALIATESTSTYTI